MFLFFALRRVAAGLARLARSLPERGALSPQVVQTTVANSVARELKPWDRGLVRAEVPQRPFLSLYIYIYTYIYIYIPLSLYIYIYAYMPSYIYIYMYVHIVICVYVCVPICVCVYTIMR